MTITNVIDTSDYFVRNTEGKTLYVFDRDDFSNRQEAKVLSQHNNYTEVAHLDIAERIRKSRSWVVLDREINAPSRSFLTLDPEIREFDKDMFK